MTERRVVVLTTLVACVLVCSGCGVLPFGGPRFVLRVNCASNREYVDESGRQWLADQYLEEGRAWGAVDGLTVDRGDIRIPNTSCPEVYRTERYNMSAYHFKIPDGRYTVRLHFAETYEGITGPGMRVFSVAINGRTVLEDFDPYTDGGGLYKPIVKELKRVEVVGGRLVISFEPKVQNPEINGIEVVLP